MFRNIVSKEQIGRAMHIKYDDGSIVDYDIVDMGNEYFLKGKEAFISRFGFDLDPFNIKVDGVDLPSLCSAAVANGIEFRYKKVRVVE